MKLVALVGRPERPDDAVRRIADVLGLPLAEARMRVAPEPPAVVARLDAGDADRLLAALRAVQAPAVSIEEPVPSDKDRTVASSISPTPAGATFTPRFGAPVEVAWPEVVAVLRGLRHTRIETERTEKSKTLSLGRAVVTGGLQLTRTSAKTVRSSDESTEQVLLVYAKGHRTVLLSEHHLEFSFLGRAMQPSSTANMTLLATLVREAAKSAVYDDRLVRLGRRPLPFVAGGSSAVGTHAVTTTRTDSGSSLDVLAEVLRTAIAAGLLR